MEPCHTEDILPLLNELPVKDLLSLVKTNHLDPLLSQKFHFALNVTNRQCNSKDSIMSLFQMMIKQPQYGSLSNSQRLFDSIVSLLGSPLILRETVHKLLFYVHLLYNPFNTYFITIFLTE